MFVAIEGADGAGKNTTSTRLRDLLIAEGRSATIIAFPRYGETVAGVTMGSFSMLGCGQSPDQQERVLESPLRTDIQLYSRKFVIASRHAFGMRREFLASLVELAAGGA